MNKIIIIKSLIILTLIVAFSGCSGEFKKTLQDSISKALNKNSHKYATQKRHSSIFIDKFPIVIVENFDKKNNFKETVVKTMDKYFKKFGKKDFEKEDSSKYIINKHCYQKKLDFEHTVEEVKNHNGLAIANIAGEIEGYNEACRELNLIGKNCKYVYNANDLIEVKKERYEDCIKRNKDNFVLVKYIKSKETHDTIPIGIVYYNGKKQYMDLIVAVLLNNKIYFIQFEKTLNDFFQKRYYNIDNSIQNKILKRLKELKYLE